MKFEFSDLKLTLLRFLEHEFISNENILNYKVVDLDMGLYEMLCFFKIYVVVTAISNGDLLFFTNRQMKWWQLLSAIHLAFECYF
jgi:hypothetical protein